jgi:peptidoglycan/LPS O-acetylase OafA/YrhL
MTDGAATTQSVLPSPGIYPERFDMLDAWRGLAAVGVVLYHLNVFGYGHESVILFFVISGYCIVAAAESCMKRGLGFRGFMWRRIRRIYPPYVLSLLFFIATRMVKTASGGENQLAQPLIVWVQNFTLTQWVSLLFNPQPQAFMNRTNFVGIYWSLNYEEQFYLLVAGMMVLAVTWGIGTLRLIVPLLAVALAWNLLLPDRCYGVFIEYWAHFAIGCLLFYRLCRMNGRGLRRTVDLFFLAVVIAGVAYRYHLRAAGKEGTIPEISVAAAFALVLVMTRPYNVLFARSIPGRLLMKLGLISYSLYLVHQFNMNLVKTVASRVFPTDSHAWLLVAIQLALHLAIATVFWFCCERPFLNRSFSESVRQDKPVPGEPQPIGG